MSRYAIVINEDTLDLITVLNGGVRPQIEEKSTYFLVETDGLTDTKNHDIVFEDDLYDDRGYSLDLHRIHLIG